MGCGIWVILMIYERFFNKVKQNFVGAYCDRPLDSAKGPHKINCLH